MGSAAVVSSVVQEGGCVPDDAAAAAAAAAAVAAAVAGEETGISVKAMQRSDFRCARTRRSIAATSICLRCRDTSPVEWLITVLPIHETRFDARPVPSLV